MVPVSMPTATERWQSGDLAGCIAAQTEVVKAHPADVDARSFLFALLCHAADWDRAGTHLRAMAAADPGMQRSVVFYRGLLTAEIHRQGVFEGDAVPVLPPSAPAHMEHRLAALQAWRRGDAETARQHLASALDSQPDMTGLVNGVAFSGWRDLDDLLGSVCEVLVGGRYLWLPWEWIGSLDVAAPQRLPDLLWVSARLLQRDGEELSVNLPALYPGSQTWSDQALKLGRCTDWVGEEGLQRGRGQRMLAFGDESDEVRELPLLELRTLEFTV
jgi:type VI secretion system protein ImpE